MEFGDSLIYRCVAPIESNLVKLKLSEKKASSHEGGPYGRPVTHSGAELIWFSSIRKLRTIRKGAVCDRIAEAKSHDSGSD